MAGEIILLVEDEEDITELLVYNLKRHNYEPISVASGEDGLDAARDSKPDLVLLDLMLPGLNGLEVCRRLKDDPATEQIPVIMLTAKGDEEDIIAGFDAGADDYVTKPFKPKVLLARVKAVLRRGAADRNQEGSPTELGGIHIHPGRFEVRVDGQLVEMTRTEFRTLSFLASRPGWAFTRRQIVQAVHGNDYPVTGRSVDVQVAAVRRKLGIAGELLQTVRGVGYKMGD